MIYLISEETDTVTDNVESWLLHDNASYKRINDNFFYNLSLSFNANFLDDASTVWHRRGKFNFTFHSQHQNLNKYLKVDEKILLNIIENELIKITKYIGSYTKEVENSKLEVGRFTLNRSFFLSI